MAQHHIISIIESIKADEARIPCHPEHFKYIRKSKNKLFFQSGYAKKFGQTDELIKQCGFDIASINDLLKNSDVVFLLKPEADDLKQMKEGAILIGWCHAIQRIDIAVIAEERNLTLIAMESMYHNSSDKHKHVFYENNFNAGFLGIEHALISAPYKYSNVAKVAVITYGAVSEGAVAKLIQKNFSQITVFSRRSLDQIEHKYPSVFYKTLEAKGNRLVFSGEDLKVSLLNSDIIINGIMQDVLNPYHFLSYNDLLFTRDKLIVDLSCDNQMGFDFTCTTTISDPIKIIGNNYYYAVDNAPSLHWESSSLLVSEKLINFINGFLANQWNPDLLATLEKATEIRNGCIINDTIVEYQKMLKSMSAQVY